MQEDFSAKARNGRLAALDAVRGGRGRDGVLQLHGRVAVFRTQRAGMLSAS